MFRKTLEYGKRLKPDKMFILSAKHHLVPLDQKLEPYDLTLKDMKADEKAADQEEETAAEEEEEDAAEEEEEEEEEEATADEKEGAEEEEAEEEEAEEEEEEAAAPAEEEAEIEVSEVKIKGKTYFTTDPQNGIIYACVDDDVGDEVGVFKNGVAVFNKGKK
jgi:flagellar biosynthesis GTPase FlhF